MERAFSRGKIVIEYSADKETLISLLNQISDKTRDLSLLTAKLFEALNEEVQES